MGQCLCKEGAGDDTTYTRRTGTEYEIEGNNSACEIVEYFTQEQVDSLVLETLLVIRTKVEIAQDPPESLIKLNTVAERDEGWIQLVNSFIHVIPLSDPLGPAVMSLLLDDCPLPTRDTALKCLDFLDTLPAKTKQHRNLMIVVGCIAEKLAGPNSVALLTDAVLDYLIRNLAIGNPSSLILFSLIALEKFTQTSENKSKIRKTFSKIPLKDNPLTELEKYIDCDDDYVLRQVGFCAQWCLDNLLPVEGRQFSYTNTDTTNINMMLNANDVSEYLKLGPSGLVARCDASSFESVRGTGQADKGCWYYEVLIVTSGVMQIGWATKHSKFLNHEGYGIGDDEYSQAYDGCRQLMWYNAVTESVSDLPRWEPGDIVGCFLDTRTLKQTLLERNLDHEVLEQVFSLPVHTDLRRRVDELEKLANTEAKEQKPTSGLYEDFLASTAHVAQLENVKAQNELLKSKLSDCRTEMNSLKEELKEKSKEFSELKQKTDTEKEVLRLESRKQVGILKFELQQQRETSLALLEEKDAEIQRLIGEVEQSVEEAFFSPKRGNSSSPMALPSRKVSCDIGEMNAGSASSGAPLHYVQELSRKDIEIKDLRSMALQTETTLRELQYTMSTKEEKYQEKIEDLEVTISRLERMTTTEGSNLEYLKNVVLTYMLSTDVKSRNHMLKAIGAVLKLSKSEIKRVMEHNSSWWWSQQSAQSAASAANK